MDDICKHCGGPKAIRNPSGKCDHLKWPLYLTDEARIANGYEQVTKMVVKWEKKIS